jgi:hypothetical protein
MYKAPFFAAFAALTLLFPKSAPAPFLDNYEGQKFSGDGQGKFYLVPGRCGIDGEVLSALKEFDFSLVFNVIDEHTTKAIRVWRRGAGSTAQLLVTFDTVPDSYGGQCVLASGFGSEVSPPLPAAKIEEKGGFGIRMKR